MSIKATTYYDGEPIDQDSLRAYEVVNKLLLSALDTIHEVNAIMPEPLRGDYAAALKALRKVERIRRRAAHVVEDHARQLRAGVPENEAMATALDEDRWRVEQGSL